MGLSENGKGKQFEQGIEKLSLRFVEERSIVTEGSQMPEYKSLS